MLGMLLGCGWHQLCAAEMSYFFGYRVEYSSNVRRSTMNEESEVLSVLSAGMSSQDQYESFEWRFAPTVEYLDYLDNTFENELRAGLVSSAVWTISPKRFTWSFEDNAQQVRTDPTQPDSPANSAFANYFTTGPDLYLQATPLNTLQLGARYGNVYVAETNLDNDRGQSYGRWLYQLTPRTTLSLNVETLRVEFDDEIQNQNYSQLDRFLRAQTRLAPTELLVDVGVTRIERDRATEEEGNFWRVRMDRQISSDTTISVAAESILTDTGGELAANSAANNAPADGSTGTTSQNLVTQDIFRTNRGDITTSYAGTLFSTSLRLYAREYEFLINTRDDRTDGGGSIDVTYLYSGSTSATLFGGYTRTRFRNQTMEDEDLTYGARLIERVTRQLSATLELQRAERDSNDGAREFVDNRAMFILRYDTGLLSSR